VSAAVFVGLTTLDIAYLVESYPAEDTKTKAVDQYLGAGGPAANAAMAYAHLSRDVPTLVTALGSHYLTELVRSELVACDVTVIDANPASAQQLPVSSIVVAPGTRTIVSLDASRMSAPFHEGYIEVLDGARVVLVDAHYSDLAVEIAREAQHRGVRVVLDAGRWMAAHEAILPFVDVAICSSAFAPPDVDDVFAYLHRHGPSKAAITDGANAIRYSTRDGVGVIDIEEVPAVDTLGAGDILHGAFCHFAADGHDFVDALDRAAKVATLSCRYFGSRAWTTEPSLEA
jgi:sugar/nucleoside kinase (ribokinase family)